MEELLEGDVVQQAARDTPHAPDHVHPIPAGGEHHRHRVHGLRLSVDVPLERGAVPHVGPPGSTRSAHRVMALIQPAPTRHDGLQQRRFRVGLQVAARRPIRGKAVDAGRSLGWRTRHQDDDFPVGLRDVSRGGVEAELPAGCLHQGKHGDERPQHFTPRSGGLRSHV